MRLAPIEQPRSLLVRIAYWLSKRQLGKVMTPLKVIYARAPRLPAPSALDRARHGARPLARPRRCGC